MKTDHTDSWEVPSKETLRQASNAYSATSSLLKICLFIYFMCMSVFLHICLKLWACSAHGGQKWVGSSRTGGSCDHSHELDSGSWKLRLFYILRLVLLDFGEMIREPGASLRIPKWLANVFNFIISTQEGTALGTQIFVFVKSYNRAKV